jgi:putative ABC transport system permease protein
VSDRPDEAESFTIIGVLPANFWHLNTYTDVLTPLRAPTYPYMVRLRNGVPPVAAADRISALVRSGAAVNDPNWRAELTSTHAAYVVRVRPVLRAISVAAGLVLLISLANVAGLLLIRTTRRQKEFAVRRALGASRLAIARLLVLEAIALGLGATMLGIMASSLVMGWLAPVIERELGRSAPGGTGAFEPDLAIVVAAGVCGLVAAGACAVAPLLASWRVGLRSALHSGNRAATEGRGSQRMRSVLIALEIAASLTLVAGSTLMVQSVVNLLHVDFGIRAANVLSMPVTLRQRTYPEPASRLAFFEETLARIGAVPGVQSVALTDWWPLQPPQPRPVETDSPGQRATAQTGVIGATAEYFSLLGIPLVAGRAFTAGDRLGSADVAIVSETLARRLWPGGSPVGSQLRLIRENADGRTQTIVRQVVGVVKDVRQVPDDPDLADLYVPILQSPGRFVWVYARTAGPPAEALPQLRAAVNTIDREIPMTGAAPLQQALDGQLARPKFLASLLASFALIAALLALVGIYGVIAYAVRQREREIAVRIAVGAEPRRITGLFLKQGVLLLVAGLGIGVIGAVGAGRTLESQLFGVRPGDPLTLLMAATGLAGAAMLAVWWPARRAAATDPAAALKDE